MARKTEIELRQLEIKPEGDTSWSRGEGFMCRLLYDKSRDAIDSRTQYVIMFPEGERVRGTTEEDVIKAARVHASSLVTITSSKVIHLQWSHGSGFHGYRNGVDVSFGWSVYTKEIRKRTVKGEERIEIRLIEGTTIHSDWRRLDPERFGKDNRDGLSEMEWTIELETFLSEMEKRMVALNKQIDQMISPKHIKPKKLAAIGEQFLLTALPAPKKGSVDDGRQDPED